MPSKIAILGAGSMGTAIARVLNEEEVIMWTIEEEVNNQINTFNENKKYLPGVKINAKSTMNLKEAVSNSEIIIISVPSQAVRSVTKKASEFINNDSIIVCLTKGLEKETNKTMSQVINEELSNELVIVGGPSIAVELGKKKPTFVVYASNNKNTALRIKKLFEREYYHISVSNDVKGVELCGSFKNVIAIMAGMIDGLNYGLNTKSGAITKGLNELAIITKEMGAKPSTINGLAGLGDTIVTCMSPHSRNRRFGEYIAKGLSINQALKKVGQVVEGLTACKIAHNIIKEKKLNCPLITNTYNALFNNKKIII